MSLALISSDVGVLPSWYVGPCACAATDARITSAAARSTQGGSRRATDAMRRRMWGWFRRATDAMRRRTRRLEQRVLNESIARHSPRLNAVEVIGVVEIFRGHAQVLRRLENRRLHLAPLV